MGFSVISASSVISEFAIRKTRRLVTFVARVLEVFSVSQCLCGEL
jgi:hypothetical protein